MLFMFSIGDVLVPAASATHDTNWYFAHLKEKRIKVNRRAWDTNSGAEYIQDLDSLFFFKVHDLERSK